ncbi:MAG: SDR family NAD(P)-dependent oxidoreductase, partial [Chlamydiia bacterium]|nr:SDR family NAD(P)-dependent oxidoreductase [Chlamydiia bacterium]
MNPILVTGGAKGLGAEIVRQLAKAGHDLVIHFHTSGREAKQLVEECRAQGVLAHALFGDFTTTKGVECFIRDYMELCPRTKGLINNVGVYVSGT